MIVILQFDAVNLPIFHQLQEQGRLRSIVSLQARGHWYNLETPAATFEGATYFSLYSGTHVGDHCVYWPFMWSAPDQRVRTQNDFPAPEPVWDRIGRAGRRSLVIDPYEGRPPQSLVGLALGGWQFRHHVALFDWSVPRKLSRRLRQRFGRPSTVEEVYGRPSRSNLLRMRKVLIDSPRRAADAVAELMRNEYFDLVWITMSASHIAGHWFLDTSRLPQEVQNGRKQPGFDTTLVDSYVAVEEAMSRILDAIPGMADIIVLSPSSMEPNTSRSHLLPGMLQAVLAGKHSHTDTLNTSGASSIWRVRAAIPTSVRTAMARVLPGRLTLELTARLDLSGINWRTTRAFMVPSGDCGYVRLNLKGREREGIVDPEDAERLLDEIASGLMTFRDPDGQPAVRNVRRGSSIVGDKQFLGRYPDLIVYWSDQLPPHLAGVGSPQFGEVPALGWGSGRTGEHRGGAWALIVPGTSRLKTPVKPLHIIDVASTVCSALGVNTDGLIGQALLEPYPRAIPA